MGESRCLRRRGGDNIDDKNSLYIGLCISTTSHGVIVRLTDMRSFSSHSYWSEPDVRLCSELSTTVCTMDWSYEYLTDR